MQLLRSYSLIEAMQSRASYVTHPVIRKRAFHVQGTKQRVILTRLAVILVGWAVLDQEKGDSSVRRPLLSHAQRCWQWIVE